MMSASRLRYFLKAFAFFPPVILIAGTIGAMSCGQSIYPAASNSATATATSTATGGNFAYVTNFANGEITEFKRNTSSGILTFNTRIAAGSDNGPVGIAITSNNAYLYATNINDNTILQYTVGTDGKLTAMSPPSVDNGTDTTPEQLVTLSSNGTPTWLFVTNFGTGVGSGSLAAYPITSTGALGTAVVSTISGMGNPFGMALNASGTILYVSDNTGGAIYALSFNATTGALSNISGSPVLSLGTAAGTPGWLALNASNENLLVSDYNVDTAQLAFFTLGNLGVPTGGQLINSNGNQAAGVAWTAGTVAVNANQDDTIAGGGSVSSYTQTGSTTLTLSSTIPSLNGPTDIIVDPQDAFAYTTDQGDGTIAQFQFNAVCGGLTQPICFVQSVASDPKVANPDPYGIVLTN